MIFNVCLASEEDRNDVPRSWHPHCLHYLAHYLREALRSLIMTIGGVSSVLVLYIYSTGWLTGAILLGSGVLDCS